MNVAVIGLGKLGLPVAAVLAAAGHRVQGVDLDSARITELQNRTLRTSEPGVDALLAKHQNQLEFADQLTESVARCDLTLLVLPTPSEASGAFFHGHLIDALEALGQQLRTAARRHTVVICSTVMPGAHATVLRPALERAAGREVGEDLGLCYCPQFIALGTVVADLQHPSFVLVGESDAASGDHLLDLLRPVNANAPVERMNWINAEITKLSLNTFLTTKIAYANMLAEVCEQLPEANVDVVSQALGLDHRISPRFLKGGLAYGGPCFPRDNRAFEVAAADAGARADLAATTDAMNVHHLQRVAALAVTHAEADSTIGVLGLSYRAGTEHADASPGIALCEQLRSAGFGVLAYDPMDPAALHDLADDRFDVCTSLADLVAAADLIVIATEAPEFVELESLVSAPDAPPRVVLDCWRLLNAGRLENGSQIIGIGRGPQAS